MFRLSRGGGRTDIRLDSFTFTSPQKIRLFKLFEEGARQPGRRLKALGSRLAHADTQTYIFTHDIDIHSVVCR